MYAVFSVIFQWELNKSRNILVSAFFECSNSSQACVLAELGNCCVTIAFLWNNTQQFFVKVCWSFPIIFIWAVCLHFSHYNLLFLESSCRFIKNMPFGSLLMCTLQEVRNDSAVNPVTFINFPCSANTILSIRCLHSFYSHFMFQTSPNRAWRLWGTSFRLSGKASALVLLKLDAGPACVTTLLHRERLLCPVRNFVNLPAPAIFIPLQPPGVCILSAIAYSKTDVLTSRADLLQ